MNTLRLARDYLERATVQMEAIRVLYQRRAFANVMRECQGVVELCLKGVLRFLGIEPPPKHEISEILRLHIDRLPEEWKRSLNEIEILSRHLFEERSRAFYGDENELIPASELYGEDEAEKALKGTEMILSLFSQLLEGKSQ